jgi:hypothetical protein
MPYDPGVVPMEVQRVRHHDPVERRQLQRSCEVHAVDLESHAGEALGQRTLLRAKGARIRLHRVDATARPQQIRERQRERPFAGAEIRPDAAGRDAVAEESNVIGMSHQTSLGARGDTVVE